LRNDERILADRVVVAAGIWSNKLLAPCGLVLDAHPVMRQFFHIELSGESRALADIPMVIFPNGPFTRSSPEGLMVGYAHRNEDRVERSSGRRSIYHSGVRFYIGLYLPGFENLKSPNYVWGHYHTTPDDGPIIVNRDDGLATVCGCSGSGITKALYLGYLEAHALSGRIDKLPREDRENLALMTNERFAKDDDGDYLDKSKWITEELVL
jgi:D-amino-acid dehydrogenase